MREQVTGIGGVFLRAKDPTALLAWYREHLGVDPQEGFNGTAFTWSGGESTVWALFDHDTDYFGALEQAAMVNYRVRDLDAMLAQLAADGVELVGTPMEQEGFGKFGWAVDPEGNRFELWEPPAGS
jgi:predicted enzyme related to lactoylglutathione lyase